MVDALAPGYRLDRYELLCPIASGGMASVWLARLKAKRGFEKLFAVKTIKTELVSDARFQEMFLDEARLASRIEHPNVAQILDLGEKDEILYTVMEWVDGESLAKIHRTARERNTPIPPGVALRIMADVLAGLQAAHESKDEKGNLLGVVHRDVSPQNILVTSAGAVKVIDFGVAKAKNRIGGDTSGDAVKGKIRYLAPEQTAKNADVDHRADLWAAAICLYELVTGKDPYAGLSDIDVLRKLTSDDPAPALHGLSENLVPIIPILDRALAKNPEERYESAAAMRRALSGAMDELGLTSSSEEAADFLRTHLADLERKRRERVSQALDAANTGTPRLSAPSSISDDEDVAYAPTIAAAPSSTPDVRTPLTAQLNEPSTMPARAKLMAAGVLGVALVVVFAEIHASNDAPAPPTVASVPLPASAPPPPAPVPPPLAPSHASAPSVPLGTTTSASTAAVTAPSASASASASALALAPASASASAAASPWPSWPAASAPAPSSAESAVAPPLVPSASASASASAATPPAPASAPPLPPPSASGAPPPRTETDADTN